ncbi:hypothetical protein FXW07_08315 [Methanosarcina sp. DH1]|nr:hypothetical protein [Methanosarcina sp. DH1]MCC4766614.1 hypothetical protein [Methanosarcina sp. DH1]
MITKLGSKDRRNGKKREEKLKRNDNETGKQRRRNGKEKMTCRKGDY